MKRWIFMLIIPAVLLARLNAAAFCEVLGNVIENDEKLFFSYIAKFESGEYLITASLLDKGVMIYAFNEADGTEKTDELLLKGNGRIEIVSSHGNEYIMHSKNAGDSFYTIEDDMFKRCEMSEYNTIIRIATVSTSGVDTHKNTKGAAYNLLNDLKQKKMSEYSFINRRNSMSEAELLRLRIALVSAADIMSFDSKNCDVDKLMKYVLNTNRNFLGMVPFVPEEYIENDGIKVVDAEYIDYIIKEIFGQEPIHPPINELTQRGYCFNGSNYYYTDAFSASFATEVRDIKAVYDIGDEVYYVVFGDIYTENGVSIPEYSYMILKDTDNGYKILRLEMGGELLSEHEVMEYAGVDEATKYMWESASESNHTEIKSYSWIWIGGVIAVVTMIAGFILFKNK